jgi:hypothetical protein
MFYEVWLPAIFNGINCFVEEYIRFNFNIFILRKFVVLLEFMIAVVVLSPPATEEIGVKGRWIESRQDIGFIDLKSMSRDSCKIVQFVVSD